MTRHLFALLALFVAFILPTRAPALQTATQPAPAAATPAPAPAPANPAPKKAAAEDQWYIVELNGQRSGYMHSREERKDGKITTTSSMVLAIKRGAAALEITIDTEFVETEAGKPISMTFARKLGSQPQSTETRWTDDGVEITEIQNGNRSTHTAKAPAGEWLTPGAADRYVEAELAKNAKQIGLKTIDPSSGLKVFTVTRTVLEHTNIDVVGRTVPAIKWESEASIQPGIKSVEYAGLDGRALRTDINLGGLTLRMTLADKDLALAKMNAPELLVSTLVKPDKPINKPRLTKKAVYKLSVAEGEMPMLLNLATQTCERIDAKAVRLTVDVNAKPPAPKEDIANHDFSTATAMLNSDDPEIRKLLPGAAPDHGMPGLTPEHLRHFTHRFIKTKNFSVGFASASEVARTKTGDCTEHGVFLAALLRAKGIPSRVVSGLIYVDDFGDKGDIFGYHMWTQALVTSNGVTRWIDLDGTLPNDVPFDATHIALGTSSLTDEDQQNFLVALAPLIGRLQITVEKVE
ncbi:MAG: transglutaminase-like domain-containing protein [Phycisphaerales bacterium]